MKTCWNRKIKVSFLRIGRGRSLCLLALLLAVLWGNAPARAATPPPPQIGEVVIHETFDAFVDAEQRVHPGWQPWADAYCQCDYGDANCRCVTPEYKQANPVNAFPYRARGGSGNAQQWFSVSAIHHAGVYRQFEVEPGTVLEWHAWAMAWSSADHNPHSYDPGQAVRLQIGVDPTGGIAPFANTVVWGDIHEQANPNQWHAVSPVRVTAQAERVTVFLAANPKYPLPHNDIYFDDVVALYQGFEPVAPSVPVAMGEGVGRIVGAEGASAPPASASAAPAPDPALSGLTGPETPAETGGGAGWRQAVGVLGVGVIFWWTKQRKGV